MVYKKSSGEKIFDSIVYILIGFSILITIYPLIYIVSMSISDPLAVARGEIWLLPKGFSLIEFKKVLGDTNILLYYGNTLFYTVAGTICGILVTALGAYPLSRKEFVYRNTIYKFIMLTMFFNGGIMATYIVVARFLRLYDSRWVLIILGLSSAWYITIAKNYFQSLPEELFESARIDGASEFRIFGQIVLPLSKPILAVLALYMAVHHWNSYFDALLYLADKKLRPLSLYIRTVVVQNTMSNDDGSITVEELLSFMQLKYVVIVISVLPLLLIYPFISKYLRKGLMIGAVKG